jgi:hypothetical protein
MFHLWNAPACSNVLELLFFFVANNPENRNIAVLLLCGDARVLAHVHAACRRYQCVFWRACPRCHEMVPRTHISAYSTNDFYEFEQRVARAAVCSVCRRQARSTAYVEALDLVMGMSEFNRRAHLSDGFCCRCGSRVSQLQLHQRYTCPLIEPDEPFTPPELAFDSDGSS